MKLFNSLKKLFNEENSKKNLINLIVILLIGIILVITASFFTNDENSSDLNLLPITNSENMEKIENEQKNTKDHARLIEEKLENILSQMKGVGDVNVMVTLEDTIEKIPAINTSKTEERTHEKDSQGGTRETIREDFSQQIVVSNNGSIDSLLVIKEVSPKVKGVIVVAQGAENIVIKEKLYSAVKTVLGVPGNRVEIYSAD